MSNDYTTLMRPWHQQYAREKPRSVFGLSLRPRAISAAAHEEEVSNAFNLALAGLRRDIIGRVLAQSPSFFEQLVIDLMLAMGYGGRRRDVARRLGQSGDGGVDGVIQQDELGLDLIYLQAKRYRPGMPVSVSEVRDFVGALEAHHARKGVMVTTSQFTKAAKQVIQRVPHQISLLDQTSLADLMIRHNIGVKVRQSYQFKGIDTEYFTPVGISMGEPDRLAPLQQMLRRL